MVTPSGTRSVLELFSRWPWSRDAPLLVVDGDVISWGEITRVAADYADRLAKLDLPPRAHVGILLPNGPEFVAAFLAVLLRGFVPVALNARYRGQELAYAMRTTECEATITTSLGKIDYLGRLTTALDDEMLGRWVDIGTFTPEASPEVGDFDVPRDVEPDEPALILFTSGTESRVKACVLSHRALLASAKNSAEDRFELQAGDSLWDPLPMFHLSFFVPFLAVVHAGGQFITMRRFEADRAWEQIRVHRPKVLVPNYAAVTNDLSKSRARPESLPYVQALNTIGAPERLRAYQRTFPDIAITSTYGATEVGGPVIYTTFRDDLPTRMETVGTPGPGVELALLDDYRTVGTGELVIRGASTSDGYFGDPEATKRMLLPGGWVRTGDKVELRTDGKVVYLGRVKDMLKVGGENVAPSEVEVCLLSIPGVQEAKVIGIPDARLDEVPAAFVEFQPGVELNEADLERHCAGQLASFKVPRVWRIVTEWPMSATKIRVAELRRQLLVELGED